MSVILTSIYTLQTESPLQSEGLPYWTLWFLLCIIALLTFFIFLRDKSLRQRLNLFFSRAKRRLVKIRLQSRLKRENRKKDEFIKEMGQEAWIAGVTVEKGDKIIKELKNLETKENSSQNDLEEAELKIEKLEDQYNTTLKKHEDQKQKTEDEIKPIREKMAETKEKAKLTELNLIQKQKDMEYAEKILEAEERTAKEMKSNTKLSPEEKRTKKKEFAGNKKNLEKKREKIRTELQVLREKKSAMEMEIDKFQKKIIESENKIKKIEKNKREQTRNFQKETKEWKRSKEKSQKKIKDIEKHKEPLFEGLGKLINQHRVENKNLTPFYSQIDRTLKRIKEVEENIKNL
jgi:chromosome segregation ATPase